MSDPVSARRHLSRTKLLLFRLLSLLIAILLMELISWFAIDTFSGGGLPKLRTLQQGLALAGSANGSLNGVIHPYLGWVMNPETSPPTEIGDRRIPVNGFGFNDEPQPLPK